MFWVSSPTSPPEIVRDMTPGQARDIGWVVEELSRANQQQQRSPTQISQWREELEAMGDVILYCRYPAARRIVGRIIQTRKDHPDEKMIAVSKLDPFLDVIAEILDREFRKPQNQHLRCSVGRLYNTPTGEQPPQDSVVVLVSAYADGKWDLDHSAFAMLLCDPI